MSNDQAVLLISDRYDRSQQLAQGLGSHCACRTVGLREAASAPFSVLAVVSDVDFRVHANIDRMRQLLSQMGASAAPIVAILRSDSRIERVQAAALGATSQFSANVSVNDICTALAPFIRSAAPPLVPAVAPPVAPATSRTPAQNVEQARHEFGTVFGAATRGDLVRRTDVDKATASVMAAVTEGGIRQWLEIVWSYDDTTYQHCMLVTGLAAAFSTSLRFAANDQKHIIKGALLHDLGKAKIPVAILNKPGPLTAEEMTIVRTHPAAGYELLREQGEYKYEPELLEVVLRHHELLDGSGYPDGLAGAQINDLVRLVTICDIYAALIERRPYKPPLEPARAFKILQDMEGKLESALVRAFAQVADKSAEEISPERLVAQVLSGEKKPQPIPA